MATGAKKTSGGLLFVAVGLGVGVWLFWGIVAHWNMQRWEETPATIIRAKLETHYNSKGGDTYTATAEYTYQYQGRQYTGTRVSINSGSDNVGSYQEDVYRQLNDHHNRGLPFRCYVNPDHPADAILFRDLRWDFVAMQAFFAAVFGSVGFGLLAYAALSHRKAKAASALAALHPDQPWLCRNDWAKGKISSSGKPPVIIISVIAVVWNVITAWPVFLVIRDEAIGKGNRFALLALLVPALGLLMIFGAVFSLLRWRKYGQSVFEMASMPGVIGGQLAGVIRTSAKVQPENGFRVAINCVRKVTTSSGKNTSASETVLWQDEQLIARDLLQEDPTQSAIPVLFQIPYDSRPTDETDANNQTIWRLCVSAKTPGLDYSTSFELPVFKTAESNPNFAADRSVIAQYAAPEDLDRDFHEAGLIKMESPTGDGYRLVFPMARAPGMAFALTLGGLIFCAVPFVLFYMFAGWLSNTIFGAVFGLVGLILLALGADGWFYRSVVDVSPSGLTVTGGWFGCGRQRRIEANDIQKIVPTSRASSGEGESTKMYYDIDIVCSTGNSVTTGKQVPGKRLAESVIRQIEQAMGKQ